jgi:hypothetical protein
MGQFILLCFQFPTLVPAGGGVSARTEAPRSAIGKFAAWNVPKGNCQPGTASLLGPYRPG